MKLNPEKKFVVEIATLQSMQSLIQWVADLSVYLVTLLPSTAPGGTGGGLYAGAALLRNPGVLATLRELLVVARVWGLISNECLPTFSSTVSGYDVLPQLFRLITRIWLVARESSTGHDFDESLIDECFLFSAQVCISWQLTDKPTRRAISYDIEVRRRRALTCMRIARKKSPYT